MISWKIYTEHKNFDHIVTATKTFLPSMGATFHSGHGLWAGTLEESLCIEVIGVGLDEELINSLAKYIKKINKQEAILVTATELTGFKLIS